VSDARTLLLLLLIERLLLWLPFAMFSDSAVRLFAFDTLMIGFGDTFEAPEQGECS
jgi:hypothetical protein